MCMISEFYLKPFPSLEIDETYCLREQTLDDVDDFLSYYSNPQVAKYILARIPKNKIQAQEEILYCRNLFYYRQGIAWAIACKKTNKMIGAICIYMNNHHHRAEICYDLHQKYWRQGIVSHAIEKVMTFLFKEAEVHRIEALTVQENSASIGILLKLGFAFEGDLRHYRYHKNKPHDVKMYAITRPMQQQHLHHLKKKLV